MKLEEEDSPFLKRIIEITHAEFVEGYSNNTIILKIPNMQSALTQEQKIRFAVLAALYQLGPILLGVILAVLWHSFLSLLVIPISWFMSFFTTWLSRTTRALLTLILMVATIVQLFRVGIHNPSCYLVLAAYWGVFWFIRADRYEEHSAAINLVQHAEVFDRAFANNRIYLQHNPGAGS